MSNKLSEQDKAVILNYLSSNDCLNNQQMNFQKVDANIITRLANTQKYIKTTINNYNENPFYNNYKQNMTQNRDYKLGLKIINDLKEIVAAVNTTSLSKLKSDTANPL